MKMQYGRHVEYIFLASIIGLGGLAVNYMANISESVNKLLVISQIYGESLKDHEVRLRELEKDFKSNR